MISAGNGGRGKRGGGRNGTNGHRPVRRLGSGMKPMTPEQGCYGCLTAGAVILVTVLVWAFIYWYNEPDFHDKGIDSKAPTVQERLRQKAIPGAVR